MVNNLGKVLDEGEEKKILYPSNIKMKESYAIWQEIRNMQVETYQRKKWETADSDEEGDPLADGAWCKYEEKNEKYKPVSGILKEHWEEWHIRNCPMEKLFYYEPRKYQKQKERAWEEFFETNKELCYRFLGRIPFNPCVMINISPNWKGVFGQDPFCDEMMIERFKEVIDEYLKEYQGNHIRYSKYKYVIECGGEGDHLHAHIVAEINPEAIGVLDGRNSHIRRGNHSQQLRKWWKKKMPEGKEGLLKGKYAIQSIILRTEELRDDKLEYLLEEKKPEGHKNKEDLEILCSSGF